MKHLSWLVLMTFGLAAQAAEPSSWQRRAFADSLDVRLETRGFDPARFESELEGVTLFARSEKVVCRLTPDFTRVEWLLGQVYPAGELDCKSRPLDMRLAPRETAREEYETILERLARARYQP